MAHRSIPVITELPKRPLPGVAGGSDSADRHRPIFHFTAPANWLNDPNGVCYQNGRYHLFYQFNPRQPQWGIIHWGHASSADLVHWRDEPIALAPDTAADVDGCFSGSFALVDGVPTLYYTGSAPWVQTQCIAQSDDMLTWRKPALGPDGSNIVVELPPPRVSRADFRDPYVLRHDGHWYMVVGASLLGEQAECLLYRSDDGIAWDYLHPLFTSPDPRFGGVWECPNLFPVGEHWVLTVSIWPNMGAHSFVGRFERERFVCDAEAVLDIDGSAFAHLTTTDAAGQPVQWAWLDEQRAAHSVLKAGWAGAISVPRRVGLDDLLRLTQAPVPQIAELRRRSLAERGQAQAATDALPFSGRHLDIEAEWRINDAQPVGIVLLASDGAGPNTREATRITFRPQARRLIVDRSRSSLDRDTRLQNQSAFLHLKPGSRLALRVLVDGSVIEVFANGHLCLSSRVYPSLPESVQGQVWSDGASPFCAQIWEMGGIFGEASVGMLP